MMFNFFQTFDKIMSFFESLLNFDSRGIEFFCSNKRTSRSLTNIYKEMVELRFNIEASPATAPHTAPWSGGESRLRNHLNPQLLNWKKKIL